MTNWTWVHGISRIFFIMIELILQDSLRIAPSGHDLYSKVFIEFFGLTSTPEDSASSEATEATQSGNHRIFHQSWYCSTTRPLMRVVIARPRVREATW